MIKKYFDYCLRDAFNIFYSNIPESTDPVLGSIKEVVDIDRKTYKNIGGLYEENYRKIGRYSLQRIMQRFLLIGIWGQGYKLILLRYRQVLNSIRLVIRETFTGFHHICIH